MNGLKPLFPNYSKLHIVEDKNKSEFTRKVDIFMYGHHVTQVTNSIKEDGTYVSFIMYVDAPQLVQYNPHDVGR
jgi:hypothetical protein